MFISGKHPHGNITQTHTDTNRKRNIHSDTQGEREKDNHYHLSDYIVRPMPTIISF